MKKAEKLIKTRENCLMEQIAALTVEEMIIMHGVDISLWEIRARANDNRLPEPGQWLRMCRRAVIREHGHEFQAAAMRRKIIGKVRMGNSWRTDAA